jgi:hypothetical protein
MKDNFFIFDDFKSIDEKTNWILSINNDLKNEIRKKINKTRIQFYLKKYCKNYKNFMDNTKFYFQCNRKKMRFIIDNFKEPILFDVNKKNDDVIPNLINDITFNIFSYLSLKELINLRLANYLIIIVLIIICGKKFVKNI